MITMILLVLLLTLIDNLMLSLEYNQGSQNVLYVVLLSSVFELQMLSPVLTSEVPVAFLC